MTKLPLFDKNGKSSGELAVPKEIFACKMNQYVVHSALVWYLASRRRGTHNAKTRGEVSGGGKKPWRQKGTGRARAGSIRSPLWEKGGVIFGPKPRKYSYNLPKKVRKQALRIALSDRANSGLIKIIEGLDIAELKTKSVAKLLKEIEVNGKVLIIMGKENEIFEKSARNLKGVICRSFKEINVHDILNAQWLLLEKSAISGFEEVLA
jgi:large subunit ribosomal protein L4